MGAAVSVGGSYGGAEASLEVNVDQFKESMSEGTKFGEDKVVFTVGGEDLPEPIAIKLVPLYEALKPVYFNASDAEIKKLPARCSFSDAALKSKFSHVTKAFQKYPEMKDAINPTGERACEHFEITQGGSHVDPDDLFTVHLQTQQSASHSSGPRELTRCPQSRVHSVQRANAFGILEESIKTAKTMMTMITKVR